MKCQERLFDILHDLQGLTIAVSGGVDSTLLAYIANLVLGQAVKMVHAISPAVPATATERVKRYAKKGTGSYTLLTRENSTIPDIGLIP